jgi:parallel beta-helix repeat protein
MSGLTLAGSSHNTVENNYISFNGKEGIYLFYHIAEADRNRIIKNEVVSNGADGIFLSSANFNNLSYNIIGNSGGYDIHVTLDSYNNTGVENRCDTTYNWNDISTTGCTYPFVLPPSIISFSPPSPVVDFVGAERVFSITVDQIVNVSWFINGTLVQADLSVTEASYTNLSAALGKWNVTVIVENVNGSDMQTWEWYVYGYPFIYRVGVDITEPYYDTEYNSQIGIDTSLLEATDCRWYDTYMEYTQEVGTPCEVEQQYLFTCTIPTPEGTHTKYISCINALGLSHTLQVTWTSANLGDKWQKEMTPQPTIVTLQGKLTYANDTPVLVGSIRVTIYYENEEIWQDTFNDSLDKGVFNIPLGAIKELNLIPGVIYQAKIEIDAESPLFISADVIFGDGIPVEDIVKFVT